jgi:hypothetical protein
MITYRRLAFNVHPSPSGAALLSRACTVLMARGPGRIRNSPDGGAAFDRIRGMN